MSAKTADAQYLFDRPKVTCQLILNYSPAIATTTWTWYIVIIWNSRYGNLAYPFYTSSVVEKKCLIFAIYNLGNKKFVFLDCSIDI